MICALLSEYTSPGKEKQAATADTLKGPVLGAGSRLAVVSGGVLTLDLLLSKIRDRAGEVRPPMIIAGNRGSGNRSHVQLAGFNEAGDDHRR